MHALAVFRCSSAGDVSGALAAAQVWQQQQPGCLSASLVKWFSALVEMPRDSASDRVSQTAALPSDSTSAVYCSGASAFDLFASNGGNVCGSSSISNAHAPDSPQVPLYNRLSTIIANVCVESNPSSLLDIGFGSGLALVPALRKCAAAAPTPALLLVEPSPQMLAQGLLLLEVSPSPLDVSWLILLTPASLSNPVCPATRPLVLQCCRTLFQLLSTRIKFGT
jgi:hypothetical protein